MSGVVIGGTFTRSAPSDTYPTHDANLELGGLHSATTHTDRDAIPAECRYEGMQCYTANDVKTWQLQGGLGNGNWVDVTPGGTGQSVIAEINFSYGDATPRAIYSVVGTQRVWQVLLSIGVPFNGTSPSLSIGDAGDADRLMTVTQNDPKTVDVYSTNPAYEYTDGSVITLTITPGAGASAGSGKIQLFF